MIYRNFISRKIVNILAEKFDKPMAIQSVSWPIALSGRDIISIGRTGSGKTFIAILLIKEYAFRLIENGEKAVFLVEKFALVEQQALQIERNSSLKVGRLHGGMNFDFTKKESLKKLHDFIQQNNVFVSTAQVFLELIQRALFKFGFGGLIDRRRMSS